MGDKRLKTVKAMLVAGKRRQAALLSVDPESSENSAVLVIDGVPHAPDDLPAGAYLEMDEPETADLAAIAGYAIEPPHAVRRRAYSTLGKLYGIALLGGAAGSLFWAVREALELDLIGVLAWLGLATFLAILGLGWWVAGEETMLDEDVRNRFKARRFRRWLGSLGRKR